MPRLAIPHNEEDITVEVRVLLPHFYLALGPLGEFLSIGLALVTLAKPCDVQLKSP